MIAHVIKTANLLNPAKIVVVIGPGMEEVAQAVRPYPCVIQKKPLGTGDAVKSALSALKRFNGKDVLVLYGDTPLVRAEDLKLLFADKNAAVTIAAMRPANPEGYGRLVLNEDGSLKKIIEHKDATKAERSIDLCNAGLMRIDARMLKVWIKKITNANAQKEFYLTDLPAIAADRGYRTSVAEILEESACGVNDRLDLAVAERIFQDRKRTEALRGGVTMIDPGSVYFSLDTKIEPDVVIEPGVFFGPGVKIGAGSIIRAFSHLEGAVIGRNVSVGPFARLRPGSAIGEGARIGNFVEVKKSSIGRRSKINHLAYVGDTAMGEETNFSAGAITVNYDGFSKHKTVIGRGVMVGSNVNLIAPVTVHDGAFVAAGSTVTEDVPANALSIGRSRPEIRKGWAGKYKMRKKKK